MGLIVLANGCFDCLHIGHVAHLEAASKLGTLTVGLTVDEKVNKGPGRPVFCWEERAYMLLSLRCVADVIACESGLDAIEMVRPDIFVKGMDWANKLDPEKVAVEAIGGQLVNINSFPVYSSTKILTGRMLHDRVGADRKRRV